MRPEHWDTGIKDKGGIDHYKCRYWCECGNKGKRYIPLGKEFLECHECGYHIDVRLASKVGSDGIPIRDMFGSFYIADSKFEGR